MNRTALLVASMLMAGTITSSAALAAGLHSQPDVLTVQVEATDNIFAAGLTAKSLTRDQGTLPSSIPVHAGQRLMLTASGTAQCCSNGQPEVGPQGFEHNPFGSGSHITNPFQTRIAAFHDGLGAFALVGAFNGPGVAAHTPFKIGASRVVTVPPGATRLYLGYADSYGFNGSAAAYGDNSGEIIVTVTPQPGA
jgi:hypothetical protein